MQAKSLFDLINEFAYKVEGHNNACTTIAITIVSGVDFREVWKVQRSIGHRLTKKAGGSWEYYKALNKMGWDTKRVPIPVGAKTPKTLQGKLDPNKRYIVEYRGHVGAYFMGKLEDHSEGTQRHITGIIEVTKAANDAGTHDQGGLRRIPVKRRRRNRVNFY